ncbi:hypothetical protein LWI28_022374 [Acer negundo]|uniref:Peptidase metallopeptidase domain-containing protein n=1 Tax=Acer negundo TaxID=4023 RepID=A0AAD5IFQ3_ACENE|nr:hypothetical protein LWI28_022374 [Acer negundo]
MDGIQSLYGANPDSSESSPSSHAQKLFRGTPAVSRWCGHAFDGVLGELAHAYAPLFGWFHFENDENWVVHQGDQPGHNSKGPAILIAIDLESVAIHEIGHLLGLGHSVDQNAIMFPTLTNGVRKIELQKDDVDGIQSL